MKLFDYTMSYCLRKMGIGFDSDKTYFGKKVLNSGIGNEEILKRINSKEPCMIARIGTTEMRAINAFFAIQLLHSKKMPMKNIEEIKTYCGFFPAAEDAFEKWINLYLQCSKEIDIFGVFGKHAEDYYLKYYAKNATLVQLKSLEPYYHDTPWSVTLRGKRVLVVHPFSESIQKQYLRRERLFSNKDVLPKFELHTIQAVQTLAGNTAGFSSWFDALEYMKQEIMKVDFDVAILGCGAYAFPLAAYIKQIGKKSIVTAGATQILFGIKGARWDNHPIISMLYNEYWIRPDKSEIPQGAQKVENGCYW